MSLVPFPLSKSNLLMFMYISITKSTVLFMGICRGKKNFKCSLVLRTSTPKILLVLLPNNTWHWRNVSFTCPSDIGWKYIFVQIEILLVPGSRSSVLVTPDLFGFVLRVKYMCSQPAFENSFEQNICMTIDKYQGFFWVILRKGPGSSGGEKCFINTRIGTVVTMHHIYYTECAMWINYNWRIIQKFIKFIMKTYFHYTTYNVVQILVGEKINNFGKIKWVNFYEHPGK